MEQTRQPENIASERVAEKNGMGYEPDTVFYRRPFRVYAVERGAAG